MVEVDDNVPCERDQYGEHRLQGADGKLYCRLPVYRETLPDGRSYDTIDMGISEVDHFARMVVPAGHVWVQGDNRDKSADSRVSLAGDGLGGAVPWENIGCRAEFITFSLDGSSQYLNPISWVTAMRCGRAGTSLPAAGGQGAVSGEGQEPQPAGPPTRLSRPGPRPMLIRTPWSSPGPAEMRDPSSATS